MGLRPAAEVVQEQLGCRPAVADAKQHAESLLDADAVDVFRPRPVRPQGFEPHLGSADDGIFWRRALQAQRQQLLQASCNFCAEPFICLHA